MLAIPQKGLVRFEHNVSTVGTLTPGTSCTTGAGSSTKGTPAELITSTAFDAYWVKIMASNYGVAATTSRGCLDILIGAATESILIADLLMGFCGGASTLGAGPKVWEFPLYIPAGSRIAAQVAGDRLSTAMRVGIFLYGGSGYPPFRVGTRVDTYGIGTVPAATAITPGASGAEGAWTQITASTTVNHFAFVPSAQGPTGDTSLTPIKTWFVDMGVGGAGVEDNLGSGEQSYIMKMDTGEMLEGPYNSMPTFQDVPAASRLSMRISMSGAADTVATLEGAIHAVS